MTVSKITTAPTPNETIGKINEIIDNLGGGGTATDVQINGTSITSNNVANIVTNTAYNASSNKMATMSDVPSVDSALSSTSTNPVQNKVITTALNNKQGTISDLSTIRSGASAGATAVQPDDLATVATSGNYNDLTNKPTIPTVNNATLTIQKNGTTVKTFTANASSNVTANITVPTDTSDLTNGAGYTTNTGTVTSVNNVSPDSSGNVSITIPTVPTNVSSFTNDSKYISNTATGSNALTILGTSARSSNGINIGASSSAGNGSTAVGYNTAANAARSTSLGYLARIGAATTDAIQIGSGTNSTATTLSVGFYNKGNYQLLDGTTGLIPDARLSSNIARTSQIPTIPTNISAFTNDSGYITGISSSDVTTALGYTPYNSTNPSGYQANVIETVKVNGTAQTVTSKAVNISVPTKVSQLTNDSGYTTNTGTVTSVNNVSPVNGNVTLTIPSEVTESTVSGWGFTKNTGTVTSVNNVSPVNGNVSLSIPTVPTNISAFNNDSGYITGITSGDITTALGYTPTSPANVDGQWVFSSKSLSTSGSKNTYTFNLSSSTYNNYLPSDNYCYEVLLSFYAANNNSTKAQAIFTFGGQDTHSVAALNNCSMCTLNGIFPLDITHTFTLQVKNQAFSSLNLSVLGYRRLGTNG